MPVAGVELGDGTSIVRGGEPGHRVCGEVAAVVGLPFVVGVSDDGADEADHRALVREDPDTAGASFSFLVESRGFVARTFTQWKRGKLVNARTSALASTIHPAIFGTCCHDPCGDHDGHQRHL